METQTEILKDLVKICNRFQEKLGVLEEEGFSGRKEVMTARMMPRG